MANVFEEVLVKCSETCWSKKNLTTYLSSQYPKLGEHNLGSLVNRLEKLELIDESFSAYRLAQRYDNRGDKFIRNVLQKKGFNDAVFKKVMVQLASEEERAKQVIYHHFNHCESYDKRDVINLLLARQFKLATIEKVLECIMSQKKDYDLNELKPNVVRENFNRVEDNENYINSL